MWENLRKFGLEYCDLSTMIWNVSFMLRALTLNIDNRYVAQIPVVFYITTPILFACYLYSYFLSVGWFVFVRCMQTHDLVAAMIVFSLGITSEIGVAKFINTCIYRKEVQVLLEDYLDFDSTTAPDSRFNKNLLNTLRTVKRRALIYWIVIVSNGILYILKPLLMPGRQTMQNVFILYKLEPEFETPNYEIAYFLSAAGIVLTCYLTPNMAAFLIIVAGYVEAQLLALSEELYHLWEDVTSNLIDDDTFSDDDDNQDQLIKMKLKDIIISHAKGISLLNQVEAIFNLTFAFEFLILSVGLIAELLGGLKQTYMQVPFAIIQVGMDCLTGQRVMDASVVFKHAVYACKWEQFNSSNMKTVLIMLIMAQRSLSLSAGGMVILNFTTLMSVFKSIYTAFTTLQSVV